MKNSQYLPYAAGVVVSIIFGMSFMFTKQALDSFSTFHLLAFRFSLAALMLSILAVLGVIKIQLKDKPIKELLLLCLFQPISYFIFETFGVKLTSTSMAGMMIALIPVVVTLMAMAFLGERPNKLQNIFIVVSVVGVLFIIALSGNISTGGSLLGILALSGAVLSGGTFNILSRRLSKHFTAVEITFIMMWIGAIVFNLLAMTNSISQGTLGSYFSGFGNWQAISAIVYLGILSSICAFFMLNYMLSKLTASSAAVFSNLTTVVSVLAGVLIRHESFSWYQLLGGALIILGVWGTNYYGIKTIAEQTDSIEA